MFCAIEMGKSSDSLSFCHRLRSPEGVRRLTCPTSDRVTSSPSHGLFCSFGAWHARPPTYQPLVPTLTGLPGLPSRPSRRVEAWTQRSGDLLVFFFFSFNQKCADETVKLGMFQDASHCLGTDGRRASAVFSAWQQGEREDNCTLGRLIASLQRS